MAVSPLIIPPASADRNGQSSKSKLSASVVASNGENSITTSPRNAVIRDLAEQMNEEEKHKYVKGIFTPAHTPPPGSSSDRKQARSLAKGPMRMSILVIFVMTPSLW
jgi:hypothetical protein